MGTPRIESGHTDEELVEAAVTGDNTAFDALVERHLERVYSFTVRFVGNQHDAEDITQEVWLKVWRSLARYDSTSSKFTTWLMRVVRNAAVDQLRKKKLTPFSALDQPERDNGQPSTFADTLADKAESTEQLMIAQEDEARVQALVAALPEASRTVLILHYTHHHTFEEISQILEESINTVKSRHRRAIIALRDKLHPDEVKTL